MPASLERTGSVRGFWVSRAFRRSGRYAVGFAAAALALGRVLQPGSLSYDLLTPGVAVAITDSLILLGLVLALAGRGSRAPRWRRRPACSSSCSTAGTRPPGRASPSSR